MSNQINLSDKKEGKQTIEELWISISKLSTHIVSDNNSCNNVYPINIRKQQIVTLHVLISSIEEHNPD